MIEIIAIIVLIISLIGMVIIMNETKSKLIKHKESEIAEKEHQLFNVLQDLENMFREIGVILIKFEERKIGTQKTVGHISNIIFHYTRKNHGKYLVLKKRLFKSVDKETNISKNEDEEDEVSKAEKSGK